MVLWVVLVASGDGSDRVMLLVGVMCLDRSVNLSILVIGPLTHGAGCLSMDQQENDCDHQ